jgi:hypothetical protein
MKLHITRQQVEGGETSRFRLTCTSDETPEELAACAQYGLDSVNAILQDEAMDMYTIDSHPTPTGSTVRFRFETIDEAEKFERRLLTRCAWPHERSYL